MGCASFGYQYGAGFTALAVGTAATTVIAELTSPGTNEIRVQRVSISGLEATANAANHVQLIKESTNSTGGTKTAATAVPFSTFTNGIATPPATAVFNGYTVTPTAGTLVGVIACGVQEFGLAIPTLTVGIPLVWDFTSQVQVPTLNSVTEALALTLNSATPANAPALDIYVWWVEVPLFS
jgi:hypothetical protein